MNDVPLACSLPADELTTRRQQLLPGLLARASGCEAHEAGYRITFLPADGVLDAIAGVIDAERRCCRFLRFQLTVENDGGPITLDISGPAGTRALLDDLLSPQPPSVSSA